MAAPRLYQDLSYAMQLYVVPDMEGFFGGEKGMRITSDLYLMGYRQLLNLLRGRLPPRLGLCRRSRAVLGVEPPGCGYVCSSAYHPGL